MIDGIIEILGENAEVKISLGAFLFSVGSLYYSYKAKKSAYGQSEIAVYDSIKETNKDILESSGEDKASKFKKYLELNCNAYESACSQYLDGKLDKKRFRKNQAGRIKAVVESEQYEQFYYPKEKQTKFSYTMKFLRQMDRREKILNFFGKSVY